MRHRYLALLAVAATFAACDSALTTDPTASIDAGEALTTARGVELALTGAYRSFQTTALYNQEVTVTPEMYADNLDFTGTFQTHQEVNQRDIRPDNVGIRDMWANSYAGINRANNVLDAIPHVGDLSGAQATRFRGEALFIRGLHYFNLVRYFGGVPLVLEPSRGVDAAEVARASEAQVYGRIEEDLEEAVDLLPAGRVHGRATAMAARALLAKVYLEQGKWADARDMATALIESPLFSLPDDYRSVFETKNSAESIFELQYSINNSNALAYWYFPQELGGRRGHAPTTSLYNAFPEGDARRDAQIGFLGDGTIYGYKFHRIATNDDNVIVLRLAEMYLVRAEANARLGADAAVVRADVDVVRDRAGLGPLPTSVAGEEDLISAILLERRLELAMEGHRFFDLRRTGRAMNVLGIPQERLLFPIPQAELDVNRLLDPNPGY